MGINVYDVRAGVASLKGEGITRAILWPGAGVGGHCLTKDTYHLERGVQVLGGDLDYPPGRESLYTLARGNQRLHMPEHMLRLTESALAQVGKTLKGSKDCAPRLGIHQRLRRRPEHPGGAVPRCGDCCRGGGCRARSLGGPGDVTGTPRPGSRGTSMGVLAGADAGGGLCRAQGVPGAGAGAGEGALRVYAPGESSTGGTSWTRMRGSVWVLPTAGSGRGDKNRHVLRG